MSGTRVNRSLVLTPPGAGAIGVVRVIGPDAFSIVSQVFRPRGRESQPEPGAAQAKAREWSAGSDRLLYGQFVVDDEVVDEVLVSRVSTSGLPAVDISAHGGVRVIERILQALERHGAPFCEVREFSIPIWPVHNLIEREAAEALSRAKTERAVRFLAWQWQHLVKILERVASLGRVDPDRAARELEEMVTRRRTARTLIEGATVVLEGPPNSGKSTLFNHLVGRSAAIVSARAGTTRDWVTGLVELDGVPVTLVDTAGRGEPDADSADGEGDEAIESGGVIAKQADVCLVVLDGSQPLPVSARHMRTLLAESHSPPCRLVVINKADLGSSWNSAAMLRKRVCHADDPIRVSARTGTGIDGLTERILRGLGYDGWADKGPCLFTGRQAESANRAIWDLRNHPETAERSIRRRLIGIQTGDP